jgi:hypothetical protein
MPPSTRYELLQQNVTELARSLLPSAADLADLSVDLTKVDGIENRTAAFLVLCHAELEAYLEDRSREIAEASEQAWLVHHKITPAAFALMAFYSSAKLPDAIPKVGDEKHERSDLTRLLQTAVERHLAVIGENHGIKTQHLLSLVVPIGMRFRAIPDTAMAELHAYGAKRGSVAHNSNRVRATLNPREEKDRADRVLVALVDLDSELSKL